MKIQPLVRQMLGRDHPFQVILYATAACNLRCRMCFYWRQTERASPGDELTLGELEALSRTLKPFPWLLVGGGEPFLRPDLADLVRLFVENSGVSHVTVPTNAWHTERIVATMQRLCAAYPRVRFNLDVSVLGTPALHDEVAGVPGARERLEKTCAALQPLRTRHPNFGLGAIFTLCRANQGYWRETLTSLTRGAGFDSVVLARTRGNPRVPEEGRVAPEAYRAAADWLEEAVRQGALPGFPGLAGRLVQAKDVVLHRLVENTSAGPAYSSTPGPRRGRGNDRRVDPAAGGGPGDRRGARRPTRPCFAGRLSVTISETGTVYPCELLDLPLGDLRPVGMDFREVWRSEAARAVRRRIRDSRCSCTHECNLTTNILFHPPLLLRVAREAVRIEIARRRRGLPGRMAGGGCG